MRIKEKMKESLLRLFGHVQRWGISEPVRTIGSSSSKDLKRRRGRSQMSWRTRVKKDLHDKDLQIKM